MLLTVNLSQEPHTRTSRYLASAAADILNALVRCNVRWILAQRAAGKPIPLLYESGVRYQAEPWRGQEEFADIPTVYARKWGDCDDLAPWRVAELRAVYREPAKLRVSWAVNAAAKQRLFHITVRRADGSIEDPSRVLGMK
jgi:hypothetical protein